MKRAIKFYNLISRGNSFFIVDDLKSLNQLFSREINNQADGVIVLTNSLTADAHFTIYNKDKSRAKICGNGLACAAFYLKKIRKIDKEIYTFLTDNGYYNVKISDFVEVNFPLPSFIYSKNDSCLINAGNLHYIDLVNSFSTDKMIKMNEYFDDKINIHQVKKIDETHFKYISLESGVGFTKSCISGAVSIYFFLKNKYGISGKIFLIASGGILQIEEKDNMIVVRTEVNIVYQGIIYES